MVVKKEKLEEGYFLRKVNSLKIPGYLYDVLSSKETMEQAKNIVYGTNGKISEYDRVIEKGYIRKWKIVGYFHTSSKIMLIRVSDQEIRQEKIDKIIMSLEYNIEELKKLI